MFRSFSRSLLWRGLLAIAVGIIAIVGPGITITSVVVIFAIAAFTDATVQASRAFASDAAGPVADTVTPILIWACAVPAKISIATVATPQMMVLFIEPPRCSSTVQRSHDNGTSGEY